MSSNRAALISRSLLALCLAATAAACTSMDAAKIAKNDPPLTPTEQFSIKVSPHDDQIMLAPHADALSPAQEQALQDLTDRWRDAGDGLIRIQTPTHGGEDAYRASAMIQDALVSLGVRPDQVRVSDYDPGARPRPPIVVGFTRYEAKGPQCGQNISNFSHTANNDVNSNFGCATTANIAAMIANPADLLSPRDSDPSDAGRREVVIGKYRQGQITSTTKDTQASGMVSSVGQ